MENKKIAGESNQRNYKGSIKSVEDIQQIVKYTQEKGRCIYRGFNKKHRGMKRVNSSLYRKHPIWNKYYQPYQAEEEIIKKFTQSLPQYANHSNISILSDLRHFGHPVNVIDFSYNLFVALFFACHGETKNDKGEVINADGELYVFDIDNIDTKTSIEYSEFENYPELFCIDPVPTSHNTSRITVQRSVFVYSNKGYIPLNTNDYDIAWWTIDNKVKSKILDDLRTHHNIDQQSIYNDIVGFIDNEENSKTMRTYLYAGSAFLNRAMADNSDDDINNAIANYNKAIEINPKHTSAYFVRGAAYDWIKEYQKAIEDFTIAIGLNPNYAIAYRYRGNAHDSLKEYEKAIADFTKAIALNPNDATTYRSRGNTYDTLKEYQKAIEDFTKAIELNPNDTVTYRCRGSAYNALKEYQKAIADFTEVIELDQKDAEAYSNRGTLHCLLNEHQQATADFTKAIELGLQHANIYFNRGVSHRSLKDYKQAIADFTKAIELGLKNDKTYYNRGYAYALFKKYQQAIADYDKIIDFTLDDNVAATAYHNRAGARYKLKDYQRTIEDCTRAIELDSSNADVCLTRSFAYARLGYTQKELNDKRKYYQLAINDCEEYIALNHVVKMRKFSARGLRKWLQQQLTQQNKTDGE